jgi:hypothetical protein
MATPTTANAAEDDIFSEGTAPDMGDEETSDEAETTEGGEDKSDSASTPGLLPKDFFHGKPLEVGTICKIKVEKVLDGQVAVSYVPHKAKESEEETDTEAEAEPEIEGMY